METSRRAQVLAWSVRLPCGGVAWASDVSAEAGEGARRANDLLAQHVTLRGKAEVERFFEGQELLEPGLVPLSKWRPTSEAEAEAAPPLQCGLLWGGSRRP